MRASLPAHGMSPERIRAVMREAAVYDVAWRERLTVATVYDAGGDVVEVAKDAYLQFFSTLYPNSFPSVRRFEQEIIDRAAGLLNGPGATGSVTSGGSDSTLMAWYVTPSMTGTRPGAAIAAAWAVMSYFGEDGYLRVVRETLRHVRAFQAGINAIDGFRVMGEPVMTVFACTSDTLDMFAVADGMHDRGRQAARDTWPVPTIRFMQSLGHAPDFAPYLEDLQAVATHVRDGELVSGGATANYT